MEFTVKHPWSLAVATACGFTLGYLLASNQNNNTSGRLGMVREPPTTHSSPDDGSRVGLCARQAGQPNGMSRVCIVTGGSRGIGAAVCERLAADGYKVVINYRDNQARAEDVLARIVAHGGEAMMVQADVSDAEDVSQMFDRAEQRFGSVTCCVNNAGILGPLTGLCDDATAEQCSEVMATNLFGVFHVMREACKRMSTVRGGRGGAIVNVSAGSAYTGTPLAYAMSKGALNSLSAGSVRELAHEGIRLNTVSPGPVHSDMMNHFSSSDVAQMAASIPMQRPGEPMEIAAGVAWLLSEDASFVAGANLRIAGGKSLES